MGKIVRSIKPDLLDDEDVAIARQKPDLLDDEEIIKKKTLL